MSVVFFQAEDGIRDLVRSRGLGDVYKRQGQPRYFRAPFRFHPVASADRIGPIAQRSEQRTHNPVSYTHLTLPTSDLV